MQKENTLSAIAHMLTPEELNRLKQQQKRNLEALSKLPKETLPKKWMATGGVNLAI